MENKQDVLKKERILSNELFTKFIQSDSLFLCFPILTSLETQVQKRLRGWKDKIIFAHKILSDHPTLTVIIL